MNFEAVDLFLSAAEETEAAPSFVIALPWKKFFDLFLLGQKRQMSTSEAVVAFVAERVNAFLNEEAQLPLEVQNRLRSFHGTLRLTQQLLKDVDNIQKEVDEGTPRGCNEWLPFVIEVCSDAEDVLDNFLFRQRRKKSGFIELVKRKIVSGVLSPYKVLKEIKQIDRKLVNLTRRISEENEYQSGSTTPSQERSLEEPEVVDHLIEEPEVVDLIEAPEVVDLIEEPEVVGLKEDIAALKERLLSGELSVRVISVVGIGGSGKTTLAQQIYLDVKKDFDCRAWVCISDYFVIKKVLIRIIEFIMNASKEKMESLNEEELGMMLRDHLREKRYLLVIDDVWSIEAWNALKHILPDERNKSRVVLTTRDRAVAEHADPHPHEMRHLNDHVAWDLFTKIFGGGTPSNDLPLEQRGKILEACGGLPLAISILAGLLSTKDMTSTAWSEFLEHLISHSTRWSGKSKLDKIIALSYWDLPHYLKPCFLYFGLFPKDYEISSGRLIRLWIAEGFIPQRNNEMVVEDVAEGYLEELVQRRMIQVTSRRSNGSVGKCHVLLPDLCISEARKADFFTIDNDTTTWPSSGRVRRFAIYGSINGDETRNCCVRSILRFPGSKSHLSELCNTSGKLLRVLHVHHEENSRETVAEEVGKFLLLRYLEFIFCTTESLPSSIGKLVGLQTLKLTHHGTLPNAIWNLEQLRHLNAYRFDIEGDPQLIKLSNLQTLCLRAGRWIGDDLKKLTKLKKLGIFGDLSSYHKELSDSIEKLHQLRSLKLRLGSSIPPFKPFTSHCYLYKMFLEGKIEELIEFPPNLAELTLSKSGLEQAAISALEKLQHLKILKLWCKAYRSEKMDCSCGGFPSLQLLELCELPLEEWIVEEGAMPSLKSVELIDMSHLKTTPKQISALLKRN